MKGNGNSRALFIIDLLAIYSFFFIVFGYYRGESSIPFGGGLLMGFIGFSWFFISINFNICKVKLIVFQNAISSDILMRPACMESCERAEE